MNVLTKVLPGILPALTTATPSSVVSLLEGVVMAQPSCQSPGENLALLRHAASVAVVVFLFGGVASEVHLHAKSTASLNVAVGRG